MHIYEVSSAYEKNKNSLEIKRSTKGNIRIYTGKKTKNERWEVIGPVFQTEADAQQWLQQQAKELQRRKFLGKIVGGAALLSAIYLANKDQVSVVDEPPDSVVDKPPGWSPEGYKMQAILVPNIVDPLGKYWITAMRATDDKKFLVVATTRQGKSGISTAIRAYDCKNKKWTYLEDNGVKVNPPFKWGKVDEHDQGSIAAEIMKTACELYRNKKF